MKAVHVARFGDVDVLRPVDLAPRPPFVLRLEGFGTVIQAPADGVAPGRRVAFATFGSYAEEVVIPPDGEPWQIAVPISDDMAVGQAAGLAMSGRTAVLLSDGVPAEGEGDTVLVSAGAGGGWLVSLSIAGRQRLAGGGIGRE